VDQGRWQKKLRREVPDPVLQVPKLLELCLNHNLRGRFDCHPALTFRSAYEVIRRRVGKFVSDRPEGAARGINVMGNRNNRVNASGLENLFDLFIRLVQHHGAATQLLCLALLMSVRIPMDAIKVTLDRSTRICALRVEASVVNFRSICCVPMMSIRPERLIQGSRSRFH